MKRVNGKFANTLGQEKVTVCIRIRRTTIDLLKNARDHLDLSMSEAIDTIIQLHAATAASSARPSLDDDSQSSKRAKKLKYSI